MSLDPQQCGGEAEDAHEAAGGLFVASGDGVPLLQACPKAFDDVAVVVDPGWTGDGSLVALGWDHRPCSGGPDRLAEVMAGITTIGHDPFGHARELIEQREGVG